VEVDAIASLVVDHHEGLHDGQRDLTQPDCEGRRVRIRAHKEASTKAPVMVYLEASSREGVVDLPGVDGAAAIPVSSEEGRLQRGEELVHRRVLVEV
jgi:hypothetical protein